MTLPRELRGDKFPGLCYLPWDWVWLNSAKLNDDCLRFSIEVFVSIWKLCINAAAWTVKYGLVSYLSLCSWFHGWWVMSLISLYNAHTLYCDMRYVPVKFGISFRDEKLTKEHSVWYWLACVFLTTGAPLTQQISTRVWLESFF